MVTVSDPLVIETGWRVGIPLAGVQDIRTCVKLLSVGLSQVRVTPLFGAAAAARLATGATAASAVTSTSVLASDSLPVVSTLLAVTVYSISSVKPVMIADLPPSPILSGWAGAPWDGVHDKRTCEKSASVGLSQMTRRPPFCLLNILMLDTVAGGVVSAVGVWVTVASAVLPRVSRDWMVNSILSPDGRWAMVAVSVFLATDTG